MSFVFYSAGKNGIIYFIADFQSFKAVLPLIIKMSLNFYSCFAFHILIDKVLNKGQVHPSKKNHPLG